MFADVVEHTFGLEAQVVELPAGWGVVVSSEGFGLNREGGT